MISFLVDQNFNEHIVDGMTRRDPALEFVHVREVGLGEALDPAVLEWAGEHGRTTPFAKERKGEVSGTVSQRIPVENGS